MRKSSGRLDLQLRRALRRQIVIKIGNQVAFEALMRRIAPEILPLQGVVAQIV